MLRDISTQFLRGRDTHTEIEKGAAREVLGYYRSQGRKTVLRRGVLTGSSANKMSGNVSSLKCSLVLVTERSLGRLEIASQWKTEFRSQVGLC